MNEEEVGKFLEHYGIKGMKWGSHKTQGVPRSTDRMARKDAKEAARAKMYYGQGAGTRRKLINKTVESRKQRDPAYAKAFERHLANQQMDKHASKAVAQRHRTDIKDRNTKRAGAVLRRVTGEPGTQAAIVAATIAGGAMLSKPENRAKMKRAFKTVQNKALTSKNAAQISRFMKTHGINSF